MKVLVKTITGAQGPGTTEDRFAKKLFRARFARYTKVLHSVSSHTVVLTA